MALAVCVAVGGGCRYGDGVAVIVKLNAASIRIAATLMDIVVTVMTNKYKIIRVQRYVIIADVVGRQEFYMMHFFRRLAANLA